MGGSLRERCHGSQLLTVEVGRIRRNGDTLGQSRGREPITMRFIITSDGRARLSFLA